MTVHDFQASLAASQEQADAPWWDEVYRRAFFNLANTVCVRQDGWAQRGGIDRLVNLRDGTTLKVDEKVRFKNRPDIILERWSDRRRQTPGWVQKDLTCDFIAYAFVPAQRCYLLPFQILRRAWLENGREWIATAEAERDGFRVVEANNGTYVTESIAVPIPDLLNALTRSMIVDWEAA